VNKWVLCRKELKRILSFLLRLCQN
jgi:hypothetical protein